MPTNSYHPTARMIRTVFEPHGFREYQSTEPLRIGGYVFVRDHPDGRLQMLYVFPWSNFRHARETGVPGCRLWIRITSNAPRPEAEAWRDAPRGEHFAVQFEKEQWPGVAAVFEQWILPLIDEPEGAVEAAEARYDGVFQFPVPLHEGARDLAGAERGAEAVEGASWT